MSKEKREIRSLMSQQNRSYCDARRIVMAQTAVATPVVVWALQASASRKVAYYASASEVGAIQAWIRDNPVAKPLLAAAPVHQVRIPDQVVRALHEGDGRARAAALVEVDRLSRASLVGRLAIALYDADGFVELRAA